MLDNFKNHTFISLLDALTDAIYITDHQGNTLWLNEASEKINGAKDELIGRNVKELEESGYFNPSVIRLALEARHNVSIIQSTNDGNKFLVTGHLLFNQQGEVALAFAHGRDLSEAMRMTSQLRETEELLKHYTLEIQQLRLHQKKESLDDKIIGKSPTFLQMLEVVEKISKVDTTVLITGETGVGKTFIAKHLHHLSNRHEYPFIQINCGSIPETLLESELFGYHTGAFTGANKKGKNGLVKMAEKGTLFLDEIGELPLHLQSKILQLIQEKTYLPIGDTKWHSADVRIIAATNRNLEEMIKNETFRTDLYYRLNVLPIRVPSLKERQEDIYYLTNVFFNRFNEIYQKDHYLSKQAIEIFQHYEWPGNIRELGNVIERLIITVEHDEISVEDLPNNLAHSKRQDPSILETSQKTLSELVKELEIEQILKVSQTHKTTRKMAQALGITQSSLMRRLHKYQIDIKG